MDRENPPRQDSEEGTREYSSSTEAYSSPEEDPGDRVDKPRPWWEREGYASLADALADELAMEDRALGRKPRDLRGLSLEEVVFSQPERPSRRRHRQRTRSQQVNVKLTESEHERLEEAANGYGLSPSTLARVFVVRATEAALKQVSG